LPKCKIAISFTLEIRLGQIALDEQVAKTKWLFYPQKWSEIPISCLLKYFFFALSDSGLLRMDMTSTPSTLSNGSPCSRISMRSSTTTTWTARSVSSAKSWGSPNTTEQLPRSSSPDSSKFRCHDDLQFFFSSSFVNFTFSGDDLAIFEAILTFFLFPDMPSILRSWAFPTTWGNFWTNTWMPTPGPSRTRLAKSSSSARTPSRTPWRRTPTATACKQNTTTSFFK